MEQKMSKEEKSWILYDVANSAFIMIVTATIPIYFRGLTDSAGIRPEHATSLWASTTAISILILALMAPILGAMADYEGIKKKIFSIFLVLGIGGTLAFTLAPNWITFLVFFIVARLGYSACNIFYDSMLVDVTTNDRMDKISTSGFAWGYIGSCIPFILGILLIFTKPFGLSTIAATKLSFMITLIWWIVMSIPLLKNVKQAHYLKPRKNIVRHAFRRLGVTFLKLKRDKQLLFFILGYFFYIDGVYTIMSMATTYGGEVGIDSTAMVLALLLTQFIAFPCSIFTGVLAKKYSSMKLIKIFIVMYCGICAFGFGLDTAVEFWILAIAVGICQGGIQALSRSHFSKIIPKKESSEYFGFYDIFGKFADFFGPLLLAFSAFFLGESRYGILALMLLFIIGFCFIIKSESLQKNIYRIKE